jgi:hypothetical protein
VTHRIGNAVFGASIYFAILIFLGVALLSMYIEFLQWLSANG